MASLFSFRPLRTAFRQIGSAVSASQEYSRALGVRGAKARTRDNDRDLACYIPL